MSSGIWKRGEEPPNLFERGTKIRFLKELQVGDPEVGGMFVIRVKAGATGTILSVFPKVYIQVDRGEENPSNVGKIEVHRGLLRDGVVPLRKKDGKADLKLVK